MTSNLENLRHIVNTIKLLSLDEKYNVEAIAKCGLAKVILNILNKKSIERDIVVPCIIIIGNMMYANDLIVDVSVVLNNINNLI